MPPCATALVYRKLRTKEQFVPFVARINTNLGKEKIQVFVSSFNHLWEYVAGIRRRAEGALLSANSIATSQVRTNWSCTQSCEPARLQMV